MVEMMNVMVADKTTSVLSFGGVAVQIPSYHHNKQDNNKESMIEMKA